MYANNVIHINTMILLNVYPAHLNVPHAKMIKYAKDVMKVYSLEKTKEVV